MPLVDKILSATIKYLQKKQKKLQKKRKSNKKKKSVRRKSMPRRKTVKKKTARGRKVFKKKTARKKRSTKKKPSAKKKVRNVKKKKYIRKKPKPKLKPKVKLKSATNDKRDSKEKPVGEVTHYFSRIGVIVIKLSKSTLHVGETIHIVGRSTDFKQKVQSLQIESVDVKSAKKGELAGLKVTKKAREGDKVYSIG